MSSKNIIFKNSKNINISGKLDFPADQKTRYYAIFAHCFTCSKNLLAVKNISHALTKNGIAVFRIDFTGLGESDGDFSKSNFSSNQQDLIDAAEYLRINYNAASIMIGHSLGAAAAIFAASKIDSIKTVSAIASPSDPSHVSHLFSGNINKINTDGFATVALAGREFKIEKQFLRDLSEQNMREVLKKLRKPLLIMHSAQDETVGIEHAAKIYEAAKHPKSFISLDGADHLLSKKADAQYVGELIGTWVKKYISFETESDITTKYQTVVYNKDESYTSEIKSGKHRLVADEPVSVGGNDYGPSPYDLLSSALGSCTAMTLRMYANRKKWPLKSIKVHIDHSKDYAEDCENSDKQSRKIDVFNRLVEIEGDLDREQINRLMEIADKCPVHKTLHNTVEVKNKF